MEDALKRLDKLTQEEARMAAAQILSLTHAVDQKVVVVRNELKDAGDKMDIIINGKPGLLATHPPTLIMTRRKGCKVGPPANIEQRR